MNKASKFENPLPKIDEILVLRVEKIITKLGLARAYQQIPLDDKFKEYVAINMYRACTDTPACHLVSSAPAFFQRIIE